MKICSFSVLCLFFVVSIFSHIFNPLFHLTPVNVEPLSPPVFNKISTRSNNLRFFILLSLRSRFFYVFVICVDFRVPLGTHLNQNGVKMVPKIEHLACFGTPFRHTMPKNTQPTTHNTTNHTIHETWLPNPRNIFLKPWPGGMRVSDSIKMNAFKCSAEHV